MMSQDAAVRKEIMERVRHKHQRPHFLVQNVATKLAVSGDFVQRILDQLLAEGAVRNEDFGGIQMIAEVKK